jgi:hypothetical protein
MRPYLGVSCLVFKALHYNRQIDKVISCCQRQPTSSYSITCKP